jgi:hypothetical protein
MYCVKACVFRKPTVHLEEFDKYIRVATERRKISGSHRGAISNTELCTTQM